MAAYNAGARSAGRGANALLKKRAVTGVDRLCSGSVDGCGSSLVSAGSLLDDVRSADGSVVSLGFSFPEAWAVAGGPNLDVRNIQTSDSAFILAAPMPVGAATIADVPDSFLLQSLFAPSGKYGACESRREPNPRLQPRPQPPATPPNAKAPAH